MRFYEIKDDYIEYLRKFDSKVPENKEESRLFSRKYLGVLFEINGYRYFAPLSSFKDKHERMSEQLDFIKIVNERKKYAVINLNNMIPISEKALIEFDINEEPDKDYKNLLIAEFIICKNKEEKIKKNAKKLYEVVTINKTERFVNRSCNFILLEKKSKEY